jgi:predicted nucleic acid-binding protein
VIRTYIDSGVLVAAARGNGRLFERAIAIIRDTAAREFVCSDYVKMEIIPKPTYFGRQAELDFYDAFFATVSVWFNFDATHMQQGFTEACQSGLQALDSVHIILASLSGCDEVVTTEKPESAFHRTTLVRTVSIDTEEE